MTNTPALSLPTSLPAAIAALVAACWASACNGHSTGTDQPQRSAESGVQAGAAGGAAPQAVEARPATELVCSEEGDPLLVRGLNPAQPIDHFAWVAFSGRGSGARDVLQSDGVACAKATNPAQCQAALAALAPAQAFGPRGQAAQSYYFVYTRGDAVGALTSTEDLVEFLGPIDTANEAVLLLFAADRHPRCDDIEQVQGGYVATTQYMLSQCPVVNQPVRIQVAADGTLTETKSGPSVKTTTCVGRRPDGMDPRRQQRCEQDVGAYFSEVAHLELAAVAAFALLAAELGEHGAPAELLARLRQAAGDEVRHARVTTELARDFGAEPDVVRVRPRAKRSLLELALENAREGTVRELYGAAVAAWQARAAQHVHVRSCWARIATEEAEHAQLSLDLERWLWPQLSGDERALVLAERQRAFAELRAELQGPISEAVARVAGVPQATDAVRLLDALGSHLLAA